MWLISSSACSFTISAARYAHRSNSVLQMLQYAEAVEAAFGSDCCYCQQPLEKDRASVEHLEGMNRFRLGLHIPGNVILACKRCNGEKASRRPTTSAHHWLNAAGNLFSRTTQPVVGPRAIPAAIGEPSGLPPRNEQRDMQERPAEDCSLSQPIPRIVAVGPLRPTFSEADGRLPLSSLSGVRNKSNKKECGRGLLQSWQGDCPTSGG